MRRIALVLLLLAVPAFAEDEVVEAPLQWEPGRVGTYRAMYPPFRSSLPRGLEAVAGLSDAQYAVIRWGNGRGLALAVDASHLVVDTNLDGSLQDETAGEKTRQVTIRVDYKGEESASAIVQFREIGDRVRITPWIHRRAHVALGGRIRLVALLDDNADMRFDDPKRDKLYVDGEDVGLERPFRLRDTGWIAKVPYPSGRLIRFERLATPPPRTEKKWPRFVPPKAGRPQQPPDESFEVLRDRIQAEAKKPYADRYQTIQLLGRVGTEEARQILLRLVKLDHDTNVRSAATRAMGNPAYLEKGGDDVIDIATSSWSPPATAAAAAQALHDMGHPDRERVYRLMLANHEVAIVGAAVRYLAYLGTESAVKEAIAEWGRRDEDAFRYQVYQGLRSLEGGPPREIVLEAAKSAHTSLRAQALRDLLAIDHPKVRSLALEAARVRPVVEYLGKAVTDVLSRIADEESIEAVLALAEEATASLEQHIAQALRPVRNPEAIEALLKGLKSKSVKVRGLAARTLAGIPAPDVTTALLGRAKREKDDVVLATILEALGDHGDERAVDLLLRYAKKRNSTLHEAAIRALARVGFQNPKVARFLLGLLASKRWEDRVLAIDAAAATGDPKLCRKVLPSLQHEKRPVRLAAVEALSKLRCREAVEPLITRLEQEEEVRIVDAIAKALYRVTGMNLYDDAEIWRRWWKEHGKTFVVPETVEDLPAQDAGGTRAGFYGIPVRSGRVIFVIDQSGSMSAEDRLGTAVKEVLRAVGDMKKRDYVNVILFHTTIHPWHDQLTRLTSRNLDDLTKHLKKQKPTGGTNLFDALEAALLDEEVDTIFLLSDGVPGLGKFVAKEDILREVRRLNQTKRVAIHGVSIGRDSDLLRDLAKANGGEYVRR